MARQNGSNRGSSGGLSPGSSKRARMASCRMVPRMIERHGEKAQRHEVRAVDPLVFGQ
jgi:hypothetical protein